MAHTFTCLAVVGILTVAHPQSISRFPDSVICQFERIAEATQDDGGKLTSRASADSGEIVISHLNSNSPLAVGNADTVTLQVLKRTADTVWLAEINDMRVAGFVTLFSKSGVVMYTKHETLNTLAGRDAPFGFVEIGRFRPLK